jgi:MFS family permease
VKALTVTVITHAVFTVACGFAPTYETLLVFRALGHGLAALALPGLPETRGKELQ